MRTTELHFHRTEPLRGSDASWTSWPSSRLGERCYAPHFPKGRKCGEADGAIDVRATRYARGTSRSSTVILQMRRHTRERRGQRQFAS